MRFIIYSLLTLFLSSIIVAQEDIPKDELLLLESAFDHIKTSDQLYRSMLQARTTDPIKLAHLDSLYKAEDVSAIVSYYRTYDNELSEQERDSLIALQNKVDFQNHMILRGIWEKYGWIEKTVISDNNFVQQMVLLHPPYELSEIPAYLEECKGLLLPEVKSGRMPALSYATFVDNMHSKILEWPQLYGTARSIDATNSTILLPAVKDIRKTNKARKDIGLEPLREGEYRIDEM